MAKVFPHLGSDSFPHLDNANPFRRTVTFDYGRYDYTSSIKLCCVGWQSDYKHVINWQSEAQRDAYFAKLSGHVIDLANGFARTQTDSVRVNVPYDIALTYNYVYMVVPPLTEDEPINHEGGKGVRTICAWIQEAIYYAPSATELILAVDYWTTYLPHLSQHPTLMLRRGHAPAYATSADTYLDNPKEYCTNLLTPDVSFGAPDEAASSTLIDIADGAKLLILASTIPYASIENLTLASVESGSSTAPTYYDLDTRAGHQVGVNGYEWHYGGHGYAGMRSPSDYQSIGNAMPSYAYLYALDASAADTTLSTLAARLPQFIQSIQAAYVLPRRAVNLASGTYTVAGVTLYRVYADPVMHKLADLKLTKADFGYPARYADIAKLYTYPYAHLVISDALGGEIDLRIEDMGDDARIVEQVSPMAECLRWDLLVRGVNDSGVKTYTWVNLAGTTDSMSLSGSDVARYTLELGIPTYALYLDGRTIASMRGYADAQSARQSAIVGYQSTMRSANTAKENTDDSADVGKTNADASAETNVTNTANSGANSQANATVANNLRTTSTTRNNQAQTSLNSDAVQNIYDSSNADLEYTEFATDINLKSEAVSSIQNLVSNAVAGNVVGVLNAGVSGIVNITTSSALAGLSMQNVLDHQAISQSHTSTANAIHISNASDQAGYSNTANTTTTNNNVRTANTNASNSATTAKANATRTRNVTKANAGFSRQATEVNAKAALDLARTNYVRQGQSHDLDAPVSFGMVSGDHAPDALKRRVCQVRIDTQSKSAIARAGDAMLRYGYAFDGLWTVVDWCPDEHDGCYWESSDTGINASLIDNAVAASVFESILSAGVTVWNDPAKIGGIPW